MAYTKQTWTDAVSQATAARLNYIEDGIEAAHDLASPAGATLEQAIADEVERAQQAEADILAAQAGSDDVIAAYNLAHDIPSIKTFVTGSTPAVTTSGITLWCQVDTAGPPTFTKILHGASSTTGLTSYPFTPAGTIAAAQAYVAFAFGRKAAATAAKATGVSGRGLTFTTIGAGANTTGGNISLQMFLGTGTLASSGDFTATFGASMDGCHLIIVSVTNVSTTIPANGSAYNNTSTTSPTVSLSVAPTGTNVQLVAAAWNSSSDAVTTDAGVALGTRGTSTAFSSVASYDQTAQQTLTYSKAGTSQPVIGTVVLTPAA